MDSTRCSYLPQQCNYREIHNIQLRTNLPAGIANPASNGPSIFGGPRPGDNTRRRKARLVPILDRWTVFYVRLVCCPKTANPAYDRSHRGFDERPGSHRRASSKILQEEPSQHADTYSRHPVGYFLRPIKQQQCPDGASLQGFCHTADSAEFRFPETNTRSRDDRERRQGRRQSRFVVRRFGIPPRSLGIVHRVSQDCRKILLALPGELTNHPFVCDAARLFDTPGLRTVRAVEHLWLAAMQGIGWHRRRPEPVAVSGFHLVRDRPEEAHPRRMQRGLPEGLVEAVPVSEASTGRIQYKQRGDCRASDRRMGPSAGDDECSFHRRRFQKPGGFFPSR
mmetsp:Transcript_26861/g.57580  ORF Transcript_26861/g.57580 Transcript_26861/m.57580 type:complete len:337 (-) Transcript_26861:221-1231(-)